MFYKLELNNVNKENAFILINVDNLSSVITETYNDRSDSLTIKVVFKDKGVFKFNVDINKNAPDEIIDSLYTYAKECKSEEKNYLVRFTDFDNLKNYKNSPNIGKVSKALINLKDVDVIVSNKENPNISDILWGDNYLKIEESLLAVENIISEACVEMYSYNINNKRRKI